MRSRLLIAAVLLASCGSDTTNEGTPVNDTSAVSTPDDSAPEPSPSDDPTESTGGTEVATSLDPPTTTPEPTPDDTTGESTPDRLAGIAVSDLAARLDTEADDIEVVSVEEVTWRDSSLGCPQKDFADAQVLTPGVRIVLESGGTTYSYHAGDDREPFYCVDPQDPV